MRVVDKCEFETNHYVDGSTDTIVIPDFQLTPGTHTLLLDLSTAFKMYDSGELVCSVDYTVSDVHGALVHSNIIMINDN